MPTLQTPTGVVMPEDRRDAIAEIVREHGAYLLEDDAYAFLFSTRSARSLRAFPTVASMS